MGICHGLLIDIDDLNQSELDIGQDETHTDDGDDSFSEDATLEAFINDLEQDVDAPYLESDEEACKFYNTLPMVCS